MPAESVASALSEAPSRPEVCQRRQYLRQWRCSAACSRPRDLRRWRLEPGFGWSTPAPAIRRLQEEALSWSQARFGRAWPLEETPWRTAPSRSLRTGCSPFRRLFSWRAPARARYSPARSSPSRRDRRPRRTTRSKVACRDCCSKVLYSGLLAAMSFCALTRPNAASASRDRFVLR